MCLATTLIAQLRAEERQQHFVIDVHGCNKNALVEQGRTWPEALCKILPAEVRHNWMLNPSVFRAPSAHQIDDETYQQN
jgi:hypothetical protein